jgi:hypothetical protein
MRTGWPSRCSPSAAARSARLRTSPGPHGGQWIEAEYAALRAESADTPRWWEVFSDPVLGRLVAIAHGRD